MTCTLCGRECRADARFCDGCGRPLGESPARDPRAYTPRHLADRILTSRSALEGERKHVTVLFADIMGSTELSRRLGPETWHGLLDAYFRLLAEGVHRFEGTLNQFTGDGVMALFGAPVSHEDHAERACHAALYLARELARFPDARLRRAGVQVPVRIGLNSGEVVVGKIGDDLRMDYTAHGHTVALAARVQEVAPPGRPCISQQTARLVEGFFQVADLGTAELKGFPEPIRVYALESEGPLRTRLERARSRGFSRLVGRGDELELLGSALEQALTGSGQAIGIVGDAGVGKSRLAFEFVSRCRAEGIAVCEAHCPAHGKTLPLYAVSELWRSYFGIASADAPEAAREKITRRLLALSKGFEETLPLVFDALSIADPERPLEPLPEAERHDRLSQLLRRWVQSASADAPMVLLLDDLHWVDPESDALIGDLVEAMGWTRTLLVANYRPEYRAAWLRGSYSRALPLDPLEAQDRSELLRELLGEHPSLADLARRIDVRTAGNPLFIEEIVRAAVASGTLEGHPGAYGLARAGAELELPETVQAVLAGRIDRLAEADKQVLQTAAVIGSRFERELLEQVVGLPAADVSRSLVALAELELVEPEPAGHAFTHPLTQEVAYHSQLESRRHQLHAEVARALEAIHRDRLGEQAALIAHHWSAAGKRHEAARWRQRAALRVSRIQIRGRRES